ncbi:MAG: FAD-dependent oxidoreductase [Candidatus Pacebacteria bacterium]|nr:FAD-dependent oxidoreductase [Candidatus Paceibacterota bacterium]
MYDLAIIGGGPGGIAAGVYASRKKLKTIFITEEWGGQSIVSEEIQNWIGDITVSGEELAKKLEGHLKAYADNIVDIVSEVRATSVEKRDDSFTIITSDGKTYNAKTVLITTGAHRRKLAAPGAEEFDNKGVTYCASCDGPLFSGQDVAVIGGGNAGFETAAQLLAYAKSVTLLHHRDEFKADPVTVERVLKRPNMKAITNAETTEVLGDTFVKGLKYKDTKTGEEHELAVTGVFVEIGFVPNTEFLKGVVDLDPVGRIKVDGKSQRSSLEGIWAAGDCSDALYHQNNIAAGDAIKALEDIYNYLNL